jgi:hypothetical protein
MITAIHRQVAAFGVSEDMCFLHTRLTSGAFQPCQVKVFQQSTDTFFSAEQLDYRKFHHAL